MSFFCLCLLPDHVTQRTSTWKMSEKIDYLGSLFLSLTLIALLLGFSWTGTTYPWGSIEVIGVFAAAAVLGIFLFVETKATSPVLPLSLFKNDIVTISNCIGLIMNAGMPVFTITVQNAVSPLQLGVATASTQLFRSLGGTIGIAVMGTIMQSSLMRHIPIEELVDEAEEPSDS